jgi:hypothetical protein
MTNSQATHEDAELILKLYELRREAVMREARAFVAGQFNPRSVDELLKFIVTNNQESAYVRQVYGYWDMVAALVVHGAWNKALCLDTCHEMYMVYAKIEPFIAQMRERLGQPEFLKNVEKLVEASPEAQERVARIREVSARIADMRAAVAA